MQLSSQMVLKGVNWVNWVQNVKIRSYGLERSQLGTNDKLDQMVFRYTMQKSGHMVLKGVNWVHIDKMKKSGYMVLKGDN